MSATSYALVPQSAIYAGIPATFFLSPVGGAPASPTLIGITLAGYSIASPTLGTNGQPTTFSVTFNTSGAASIYTNNNTGLTNPYSSGSPLALSILAGPPIPSAPTQVIGLIQTDDGFGNPVAASVNLSCVIEPSTDYSAGSTSTLQVATNSSGGVYQDFVVGRTYLLWIGTGMSGKTSLVAPSQPFAVNIQPGP